MKVTEEKNLAIAGLVIDILRENGIVQNNPYDVENWATEWLTNHSNLFATGKFKTEE